MGTRIRWMIILLAAVGSVHAETASLCDPWAAKIASVQGTVEAKRGAQDNWTPVNRDEIYCPGDRLRVGAKSRAAIILSNETLLRLDEHSALTLTQVASESPSLLELLEGIVHFISRVPRSLKVNTPFVNAAIEGTEFVMAVQGSSARVTVFEGTVLTQNAQGAVRLQNGESAITEQGSAPRKVLLAKPRDTVQWALYFPPILTDAQGTLAQASQLLYHGRVDAARKLLAGDERAEARALLSIIAVVSNEEEQALTLAQQAVTQAPQSAAAHLALSYAWQAKLDLRAAQGSAQQAVHYAPNDAIAWARLAELQLSVGELDEALASAHEATRLDDDNSRARSILGYAHLVQIEIEEALAAFNKAIELDQVDPLPRLGLGLAKIRRNQLAEGRREIEIAASLDPNNAIIRSYLGKAYYEEKRSPLDAEQFAMAKKLDPNDPTPWFYDAIRKQTENNPVGALEDLQQSIELNDNRAVYRSSLQLDQDEAARQASIASIYRDLNFDELAQIEAYNSLNTDYTNASAHRFLAESLGNRNRHEIARASETLQALLFSPVALNPVPPSMSETNPGTLPNAGPGQNAFNEYNNLFTRNNALGIVNVLAGDQQTTGDEVVYAELYEDTAISVGQYHYQTGGFRPNNDYQQDIFNMFLHHAITPTQSLQFEFRNNEKEFGDRRLNFDPNNFSANRRESREEDAYRIGYHAKLTPDSHLLASLIYQDTVFSRNESTQVSPIGPLVSTASQFSDFNTYSAELQYSLSKDNYGLILGAGYYNQDEFLNEVVTITFGGIPIGGGTTVGNTKTNHNNSYFYNYLDLSKIHFTFGMSNDNFDKGVFDFDQFNPKLGVLWDLNRSIRLRSAAFRTLKRSLTSNQTIEPTQIAGFTQFYDDLLGTDATNYGIALDAKFTDNLSIGIEFLHRYLDLPFLNSGNVRIDEANEYLDRLYLHWAINHNFSFSARYEFEEFKRQLQSTSSINIPSKVITQSIPLNLTYYRGKRFYSGLTATYVDQRFAQPTTVSPTVSLTHNTDTFWILDYELGYRLANRRGIVSVLVNNITDEAFNYQDTNFLTGLEKSPRFSHDRSYLVKLTLNID